MKKAKIFLSLAMAAAVVSTAAVSFAQWDVLTATASNKVTLAKPVSVTASLADFSETKAGADNLPTYTGTVTVDTENVESVDNLKMTLVPKITSGEDVDQTGNFDVVIKEGDQSLAAGVDNTVTATGNTYTVEVTPKTTGSEADAAKALGGTELTVTVTATLGTK